MRVTAAIGDMLSWPVDHGWHTDPASGARVRIGDDAEPKTEVTIEYGTYDPRYAGFEVGDGFRAGPRFVVGFDFMAGNDFRVGNGFLAGYGFKAGDSFRAGDNFQAGYFFRAGYHFRAGNDFRAGDYFLAGNYFRVGRDFQAGYGFKASNDFQAGDNFRAGYFFRAGDYFRADNDFTVGNNFNSLVAVKQAIAVFAALPGPLYFIKWVVKREDGTYWSPGWGSFDRIVQYILGQRVCVEEAEVSDQQCAKGLHVFRVGARPEHCGLGSKANLVPLLVEVPADAICFVASWEGQMGKIRVRELTPIKELPA